MRVTESIGPAWETMRRLLFRPFNLGTWFSFGLIFALQSCVEGGGGNSFRVPDLGNQGTSSGSGSSSGTGSGSWSSDAITHVLPGNLLSESGFPELGGTWIAVIGVTVLVVIVSLILLLYWLGSRGQMMAIRAVATGESDVGAAWRATDASGGRMFKFHLAFMGIALLVFVPVLGIAMAITIPAMHGQQFGDLLLLLLPVALIGVLVMIPLAMVRSLARNFVAPIMLKHEIGARDAWKRFWAIGKDHVGSIIVFWLVGIGFAIVAAIAAMVTGFLTCCLGFLPIIHQTVMAPYYVFERAWTLEILASMSPDFDVRAVPPDPYGGGGPYGGPYGGFGGGPQHGGYPPPGYGGGGYGGGGYGGGGYGGPPPGGMPPGGGFGGPPRGF